MKFWSDDCTFQAEAKKKFEVLKMSRYLIQADLYFKILSEAKT